MVRINAMVRINVVVLLLSIIAPCLSGEERHPVPSTVVPGAQLVMEYGDERFFEGPTWDPVAQKLLFTAFPEDNHTQILRLESRGKVSVWADDTAGVNGTYLARNGRMLGAQAFGHRILSYALGADNGKDNQTLIYDTTLFQPNDVVEAPNGDIYFTDPDFKKEQQSKKEQGSAVYLLRNGIKTKIITDMPVPNGLKVSLDGKSLIVGDSSKAHWRSYPIQPDGTVGAGVLFFDPPTERRDSPDGMSLDELGNYYFSGRGGVWVASPQGKSFGLIPVPEFCSNVTFGGPDGNTLYLTCSKKLYSLQMNVRGEVHTRK